MKSFRRFFRVLCLSFTAGFTVAVSEAQIPPARILPLGDSLTSGTTTEGAYRNRLYDLLTASGFNVDYVGTQMDVSNPTLPDPDHQGMGGFRIDHIDEGLSSWLGSIEDPDVVLLMIGTNDFSQNFNLGSVQTRLSDLISSVALKRPFAKIIVASLPLRTDDVNREALQQAFNAAIPGIVADQVLLGRQVSFVDIHAALVPGDLEAQGVHPLQTGYDKMADVWLPAINNVISPLGSSNPPAIVRTGAPVDLQHLSVTFSKPLEDAAVSLSNFSLDGGLSITQAVLDPVTKRTITLTTSAQSPATLYSLSVTGVRDRTAAHQVIAPGSTIAYSSFTLANGSFEDGGTAWTMTGNHIVYDTNPPYVASDGIRMLVLNGGQTPPNGVASQSFPTVPGQFYRLEFDLGILALNFNEQRLGVEVAGSTSLVSKIEAVFGNGLGNSVWESRSHTFTANSPTTTLTFRDLSPTSQNLDLLIDHVRVTAAPAPPNTVPVAMDDSYSTFQGGALVVPASGVLLNDTDAQSDSLNAVLEVAPAHGSVTLNSAGGFTYTPVVGYSGPDQFTYHANDGVLDSNVATVSIDVNAVAAGTLVNGSFEAGETGWTMTGNRVVYGSDGTYVANDGTKMAIFNAGNSTPNAVVIQSFSTIPGKSYVLDYDIGILALNTSEQRLGVEVTGATSLVYLTEAVFGNNTGNSVWATRSHAFTADSSITTVTFRDRSATTQNVDLMLDQVRVTVEADPVNTAPVAVSNSYSTNQGAALVVSAPGVLGNDSDAELNPLTAVLDSGPSHGGLTLNPNGSFTYTPAGSYAGPDSFTYHANDGSLNSNVATVSITVIAVNTAPVAVANSYSTNQDVALVVPAPGVLSNDTDAQSTPLTAVLESGPAHGALVLNANGGFSYTAAPGYAGVDSFSYHAYDGSLPSGSAMVTISVSAGASQILVNGSFEQGYAGWTSSGNQSIEFYPTTDGISEVDFNGRDLTPNGELSQTFRTVVGATYTLSFDMGVLSYVRKNQKLGLKVSGNVNLLSQEVTVKGAGKGGIQWLSKSYTFVADSTSTRLVFNDLSNTTLGIDLLLDDVKVIGLATAPDAAPLAVADSYQVNRDTTLLVQAPGLRSNDEVGTSGNPVVLLDQGPAHGNLDLMPDGGFSYMPATGFTGGDSFTYHVKVGNLESSPVNVAIEVREVMLGLLFNGGFESQFSGWSASGNLSIDYYAPTEGIRFVAFNEQDSVSNGVLSQSFTTIPGQTYSIEFDAGVLAYTTDTMTLGVAADGNGSLLSESVAVTGLGNGAISWLTQRFTFMADSDSTTVAFRDLSTYTVGIDLLLDHVRVSVLATPSAALVIGSGSGSPPVLTNTPSLTSAPGASVISMIAPLAGTYLLERSENLTTWEAVDQMECAAQESIEFFDSKDPEHPRTRAFYRIGLRYPN
jgi:lysophospholipase L1-like esterase